MPPGKKQKRRKGGGRRRGRGGGRGGGSGRGRALPLSAPSLSNPYGHTQIPKSMKRRQHYPGKKSLFIFTIYSFGLLFLFFIFTIYSFGL
jgi:hypothetical protein